ncbi:hypothetical protein Psfp_03318 [Pelotomaculum sp. FP]|nr:hypothetical protein Psfp_03318 [Pelotomaculum sp. FP]
MFVKFPVRLENGFVITGNEEPSLIVSNAKAYISDNIEELINLYIAIKANVDELISETKKHIYDEEYYYRIRSVYLTYREHPGYYTLIKRVSMAYIE